MNQYHAPIDDIVTALHTAGIDEVLQLPPFADINAGAVRDVLDGFGKLAGEVVAPTDRIGDREGARLDAASGAVSVPQELADAYQQYVDGGWVGIGAPVEHGGGGFPKVVATAIHEMFGSANLALSLNPMLTQSAVELLERWGNARQTAIVLPRLIDGSWTGTMNLTEPDSGSDLGAVRATAVPTDDGRWTVNGTKIYITWGEHDLAGNIVHLVLARTPEAPAGTKGISLFLVPRFHIADDGQLGERNGVHCRGLEHKLGINASPTCVLEFVDAVGELVGPLHGGMNAMFSMMNPARLAVGVQGVSISEAAYQQARTYATERRQGRVAGIDGSAPIIEHPDVQRMLLDIASTRDAMRLLTYVTAIAGDLAGSHPDADERARFQRRADLLTPLAKSWPTDQGVRLASLSVQVHGGMGFIEETGIAQRYRDARIAPIYEGTNGIQAIDLVGRKIAQDAGAAAAELLDEVQQTVDAASLHGDLGEVAVQLAAALATARSATDWVVEHFGHDRTAVLGGACAYLDLLAVTVAGHLLVRQALRVAAAPVLDAGSDAGTDRAVRRAQFFAVQHLLQHPSMGAVTVGTIRLRDGID